MSSRRRGIDRWGRPKLLLGLMAVGFAATMALIVGTRLSSESLAVLAGAAVGIGAVISTSWLFTSVADRQTHSRPEQVRQQASPPHPQQRAYPPVVVVASPVAQPYQSAVGGLPLSLTAPSQRSFTEAGGELEEMEVVDDERYR